MAMGGLEEISKTKLTFNERRTNFSKKITLANFQPQIIVITLFPFSFSKKIRVKAKRVNFKEELQK